jgi:hypothetical protein
LCVENKKRQIKDDRYLGLCETDEKRRKGETKTVTKTNGNTDESKQKIERTEQAMTEERQTRNK